MMNLVRQKPVLASSLILMLLLFSLFTPYAYVRLAVGALLTVCALLLMQALRKHPSHSINKWQVLMLLAACAALFQMFRFLTGIYFGFYVTYPVMSLSTFFLYIVPYVAIIASSELFRSVLLGQNNRALTVISYVVCLLGEVAMAGGFSLLGDRHQFLNVVAQTLLPAVLSNLVYHYMSRRYGMYPNLVYRLILSVLPACLPYDPAIPEALDALLSLVLPFIVWLFISALYENKFKNATNRTSPWTYVGMASMMASACLFVLLVTGHFQYGLIVIATPSMQGSIDVGDAVFYESYDGDEAVKTDDVVLFSKDGQTTIIHRVVDVQRINGTLHYITKGDANPDIDHGYITADQITGVVRFRIPYLGNAALWFRNLFK